MTGQIHISFAGRDVVSKDVSILTSRSVKTITAKFDLDAAWDEFETKTAIFANGSTVIAQFLDAENFCVVPWEVLTQSGNLTIGIVGRSGEKIMPSVKVVVPIIDGIFTDGTTPSDPSPDVYAQIIALMEETKAIAQSVRDDMSSFLLYVKAEIDKTKTAEVIDGVLYVRDPFAYAKITDGVLYANGAFTSAEIKNDTLYVQ